MKILVVSIFIVFIALWTGYIAYLSGIIDLPILPDNLADLKLPVSMKEMGESMAVLDGLFTTVAILLGLIAILLQGRALKESTIAQTKQSEDLSRQISQQRYANALSAYSARQSFLTAEIIHMEGKIDKLLRQIDSCDFKNQTKDEKWQIIKNTRNKINMHVEEARLIDVKLKSLLETKFRKL